MLGTLVLKSFNLYIFCYKYVCFVLPKNIPTFSKKKKTFFLKKNDFSRQLEGGTGLEGVSSNLNLCTANPEKLLTSNL